MAASDETSEISKMSWSDRMDKYTQCVKSQVAGKKDETAAMIYCYEKYMGL